VIETAAGFSNVVASQADLHALFGGVFPEFGIARAYQIISAVGRSSPQGSTRLTNDAIAVTPRGDYRLW
jgi:tRNA A37 threonylcarbamoyltransferase TsaD